MPAPPPSLACTPLTSLSELVSERQQFFRPTPLLRRLLLTLNLEKQDTQPQAFLAQSCAMSPAMTNQYIDRLGTDGWLHTKPLDGRSLRYMLTPTGRQQSMELLDACSAEVVRFYAAMRDLIKGTLARCAAEGLHSLAVMGASATGELILAASQEMPNIRIVAVADSDPAKQGKIYWGQRVCHPGELREVECDAVLLATWGQKKSMQEMLQNLHIPHKVVNL